MLRAVLRPSRFGSSRGAGRPVADALAHLVVVGGSAEDHAVGMTPTGRRAPFSREEVAVLDRQGVFKWADSYTFWQV